MRAGFHEELDALEKEILRMGNMVEEVLGRAVTALAEGDLETAQSVIEGDDRFDDLQIEIEKQCLALIATQQPMAMDLRSLGCALKIVTDLERMADHASDIAKVVVRLDAEPLMKPLVDIPKMADDDRQMLRDCLRAYVDRDVELARSAIRIDDEVDHLYAGIFRELLGIMVENPQKINQGAHLLLVGQYLERVGDHDTNLGEWVIYMVTGERVDMNP